MQREPPQQSTGWQAATRLAQSILECLGSGLLIIDQQQNITFLNRSAEELLNCSAEEWIGRPLSSLPVGYSTLCQLIMQTLQDEKPRFHQKISLQIGSANEGTSRPVPLRVSAELLRDEQGGAIGVVAVLEDLCRIKAIENRQRKLDRLAISTQIAASVVHEIRNPLATLSLGIHYLSRVLGPDSQHREAIQHLQNQVDQLSETINQFASFSRSPKLNLTLCDIKEILDRASGMAENRLNERGIRVHRDYDPNTGQSLWDAEQIQQVFSNLLSNAIDAMPDGGELYLRTRAICTEEQPAALPSTQQSKPRRREIICVEFEDTGAGIPPDLVERVFEPFFTTKPKRIGLGLAIAQRIIEAHGGEISLQSKVGKGTTFTIALPRRT